MTSDQFNSDHFFMSENLEERLSPESLIQPDKAFLPRDDQENCRVDDVSVAFTEEQGVFLYPLVRWGKNNITIVVRTNHLNKFFDPSTYEFAVTLFDNTYMGSWTTAEKKDGEWFVSVFFMDDI